MDQSAFSALRRDQARRLSWAIVRRTLVSAFAFAAVYALSVYLYQLLFADALWKASYRLLGETYTAADTVLGLANVVIVAGFVVGLALVVRSGISRVVVDFDELLGAIIGLVSGERSAIVLPDELAPTASVLGVLQAESEQNERAAKAAEQRKDELVVYLAHDIKTPLTSIIGYLTLLEESPDLPVEARARYTHITLEKAYRLEELLEEFFEITRYNVQSIPIERSRFDGALFVNQMMDEFYPLTEARGLSFSYDGPVELLVFADATRVARLLNNVLKNAVAYADPGTVVTLRTALAVSAEDFVWWEITVVDQGKELTPEHLERIFEKFYRADDARSASAGGAGLGLAIAREIARAHGGDIYASSDAGRTSFTIWIPQGPRVFDAESNLQGPRRLDMPAPQPTE